MPKEPSLIQYYNRLVEFTDYPARAALVFDTLLASGYSKEEAFNITVTGEVHSSE